MSVTGAQTILLPVDVSTDASPPRRLLEILQPANVVVLGYYPVPDQAVPQQLKMTRESEARERLDAITTALAEEGPVPQAVLTFTHDRDDSIERVAVQYDCDAVLTTGTVDQVERILVPLRGEALLDRTLPLVRELLEMTEASVTLFQAQEASGPMTAVSTVLQAATDRLTEAGIDADRITTATTETEDIYSAIVAEAANFDFLVLGETDPDQPPLVFGDAVAQVVAQVDHPVLVVRGPDT